MKEREHRIGLVGAGDVVERFYLPVLRKRPDLRVNAICSRSGERAQRLAAELGTPTVTTDYTELILHPDVDSVLVCSPPHTHFAIARSALRAGKNALVEKPTCATYAEVRELLDEAKRSSAILGATFNTRLREDNRWLRDRVRSGAIGELQSVDLVWMRRKPNVPVPWRLDRQAAGGGGVLADLGSHLLRLALELIPERSRYTLFGATGAGEASPPGVEDRAHASIEIDGRVHVQLKTGWGMALREPVVFGVRAYGTQGVIDVADFDGTASDGYANTLDEFLGAAAAGRPLDLGTLDDTMKLLHGLYASAREGASAEGAFAGPNPPSA